VRRSQFAPNVGPYTPSVCAGFVQDVVDQAGMAPLITRLGETSVQPSAIATHVVESLYRWRAIASAMGFPLTHLVPTHDFLKGPATQ
jgi:hypothetical protein